MTKIKHLKNITSSNIDWNQLGKRFEQFLSTHSLSEEIVANKIGTSTLALQSIIKGKKGNEQTIRFLWRIIHQWKISINWLFNGIGQIDSEDPENLLPESIVLDKGIGVRHNQSQKDASDGTYSDEVMEFVMAIDKFKSMNKITFPSWTDVYELIIALGYKKVDKQTIAPMKGFKAHATDSN